MYFCQSLLIASATQASRTVECIDNFKKSVRMWIWDDRKRLWL